MFTVDTLIESNDDILLEESKIDKDVIVRLEKSYYEMQKDNHKKYIQAQKQAFKSFAKVEYKHKMMVKILMGKKISDLGREIWNNKAGQWVLEEIIKNNKNIEDQLAVIKRFYKKDNTYSLLGVKTKIEEINVPSLEIPSMSFNMLRNACDLTDELTWQTKPTIRQGMFIRLFPDWMQGKQGSLQRELKKSDFDIRMRYKKKGFTIPEMIDYITKINKSYKDRINKFKDDYKDMMEQIRDYESQFEPYSHIYEDKDLLKTYMDDRETLCNSTVFAYKELCKGLYEANLKMGEAVNEVYQIIIRNSTISKNDWED